MRKIIALSLYLALALALCTCGKVSANEVKDVREVSFQDTELTVTLGTNKSTGYEWSFEIIGECIRQSINKSFKLTGSGGEVTGEVNIGFKGLSEGSAVIVFITPVGWNGTGAGDIYTVNVAVGTDGTILSAAGEPSEKHASAESTPDGLLSGPYAEMLRSGDYQYTYPVTYEGKDYKATIAAKDGMVSTSVVADDGSYSIRDVTIEGNTWRINDLAKKVWDVGTENAETLPDYGASLTFVGSRTIENGTILEAYDFTHEQQKCNIVFVFSAEGTLAMIIPTIGETTTEMMILEMKAGADPDLFDAPK